MSLKQVVKETDRADGESRGLEMRKLIESYSRYEIFKNYIKI